MAGGIVTINFVDGAGTTRTGRFWSADGTVTGLLYPAPVVTDSSGVPIDYTVAALVVGGITAADGTVLTASLKTMPGVFNGTTMDMVRSGLAAVGQSGKGVTAVEEAGRSTTNIVSAATTTVKSGAGFLHSITVGTLVAAATIQLYDNTAASGTKLGLITLPATVTALAPFTVLYDAAFATGLTIVTSGATDLTVTWR